MKIIDKFFQRMAIASKGAWHDPILKQLNMQQQGGAGNDFSYHKAVQEGYKGTDIVFSGTDLIASACSSVPLRGRRRIGEGKSEPLPPEHPLNKLLTRPNLLNNQNKFMYGAVAYRILGGGPNIWINTGASDPLDSTAEPLEMWSLPPTAATLRSEQGQLYYQMNQIQICNDIGIQQRRVPMDMTTGQSNIIQWNTFDPDSVCNGLSPLRAANTNWDIYRFGNIWNKMYFKEGCRPSTALVADAALPDKAYNRLKKMLDELYSGLTNGNGRALLLEGGVKPVELSKSPKDADFIAGHDQQQRDIARTLRIPPILLALGADSTFTNQEQARTWLWDETIIPLTDDLALELNQNLIPRFRRERDIFIEPDYSKVPALEGRRIEKWTRADNSKDITINESRDMKGLPPVKGGDVIMVEQNKIPLSMANFTDGE